MQQPTGQFVYLNNGAMLQQQQGQNVVTFPQNQQNRQQVLVVVPSTAQQYHAVASNQYSGYKRGASRVMGAMQIVMGVLLIAMNIGIAVVQYNYAWVISSGWWATPFHILAGSFGIAAASRPSNCTVITTMVLSIFSCLTVISVVTQAALGLALGSCYYWECRWASAPAHYTLTTFFLLFGIGEFVFALIQSILCCQACGNKPAVQTPTHFPAAQNAYNNGGFVPCYVHNQAPVQSIQIARGGATGQTIAMVTAQTDGATGAATPTQPPAYSSKEQNTMHAGY